MDILDPNLTEHIRTLKAVDFELAYLAALTRQGVKLLSRWEKPVDVDTLASLKSLGLLSRQISRTVKTGKTVIETVFGMAEGLLDLYERRSAGQAVDKSAETARFEGYVFGYPPCCIEQYATQPYRPNDLTKEQQEILFHWACPGCKTTPLLLPLYRGIHDAVTNC